jgi:hypothetical protein
LAGGKWIHDLKATTPLADAARHVLTLGLVGRSAAASLGGHGGIICRDIGRGKGCVVVCSQAKIDKVSR